MAATHAPNKVGGSNAAVAKVADASSEIGSARSSFLSSPMVKKANPSTKLTGLKT
jgi:hypothetical protein